MTSRTQNRPRYWNILARLIPSAATSLSGGTFIRSRTARQAPKTATAKALRTRNQNTSGALARERTYPFRSAKTVPEASDSTDVKPPKNANIKPIFILIIGFTAAHRILMVGDLVMGVFGATDRCCPHLNV